MEKSRELESIKYRLRQQEALLSLLLTKAEGQIFTYNAAEEKVVVCSCDAAGVMQRQEKKLSDWLAELHQSAAGEEDFQEICRVFSAANGSSEWQKKRFRAKLWTEEDHEYLLTFKNIYAEDSAIKCAAVGYLELCKYEKQVMTAEAAAQGSVAERIKACLHELAEGEKGVLFLLDIAGLSCDSPEDKHKAQEGCLRAWQEAISLDFRDADIIEWLAEDKMIIFWRGRASIDTIERKAQSLLDLFLRLTSGEDKNISCCIGAAVTHGLLHSYESLLAAAGEAVKSARHLGPGRYRLYEGDY